MFTPPPSPLPRDFGLELDTSKIPLDDGLLFTPSTSTSASSPAPFTPCTSSFLTPSSLRTDTSPASDFDKVARIAAASNGAHITLSTPPARRGTSSSPQKHARNSTVAVLAKDRAAALANVASGKKAQGLRLRFVAIVVPLLVIAVTLLNRYWRDDHSISMATFADGHLANAMWRRQEGQDESSSTTGTQSASLTQTLAGPSIPSGTSPTANPYPTAAPADAAVPLPTPFPQPFDSSLSLNFTTSSCATFFATFTTDKAFRSCRGLGLLMANSRAWFIAAQAATQSGSTSAGMTAMNALVWGTCNTNTDRDTCTRTMADLATQLRSSTACKEDLKAGNALAIAALVGFSNWPLYRDAGCLVNPRTNAYCFIEALSSVSPQDMYLYSLPLGIDLPKTGNGARPTCSRCSQAVMGILREYAGNATLPIARTYPNVQNATTGACGSDYALPAIPGSAPTSIHVSSISIIVFALAALWMA